MKNLLIEGINLGIKSIESNEMNFVKLRWKDRKEGWV